MTYTADKIRNVVLLGHSHSGKSSFAECMLYEAGEINRRGKVDEGNTISDFTNIEKERKNSIFSTLMHADWRGNKINIIDTPGSDDFSGEIVSSLKVADTAVILLNAENGVEVGTELIWEYVEEFGTPSLFVINKMDSDKAHFDSTLEKAKARFGDGVIPFQYPYNKGEGFNSIIDVLRMVMYVFPEGGGRPEKHSIPDSEMEKANDWHNAIVEAAAEEDESLMEIYFEKGNLSEEELTLGLRKAMMNLDIHPVFCVSSEYNMGSGRVMGFLNDIAPSPSDRGSAKLEDGSELLCSEDETTSIFIFKTMSEPQVGLVSYFKVYSGILKAGDDLINVSNTVSNRFNQLFTSNGKIRTSVDELRAGDIGVTVKLKETHTNNTLNVKGEGRKIVEIPFPEPRIRMAVKHGSKSDVEKLAKAIHAIHEEDPTFIVEHSKELKQIILHGQGQLHLDLVAYRIDKVYGVKLEFDEPKIPYRETITKMAEGQYRHKKQSGGSGQFAEVHMRIEPYTEGMPPPAGLNVRNTEVVDLPWGGQLHFFWCIVGGSIDAKFSNAIKKGILSKMEDGPLTGSYCTDIRVSIFDGKMHPVDSNDMAFMLASTTIFKNNFKNAKPQLLEPIYKLTVLCDDDVTGNVMSDLQTRRAIIMGMEAEGHYQKIIANVPLSELFKYSSSLRSLTQGKAKFHREFFEYQALPADIQKKLVSAHEKAQEE